MLTLTRIDCAQLGAFLRHRRQAAGLTIADVAARAGMTTSRYGALELGGVAHLPAPAVLSAIAAAIGVDRRELLELAGYGDD